MIEPFSARIKTISSESDGSLSLRDFHRKHKLTLMAHGQEPARELGRIVAEGGEDARDQYRRIFNELINNGPPPRSKHVNVLHHVLGHLKDRLSGEVKQQLLARLDRYEQEDIELEEIVSDFRKQFEEYPDPWIRDQTYWRDVGHRPPGD